MATWKKVLVSGSTVNLAALQVDNLTSGSVVIGYGAANETFRSGVSNIFIGVGADAYLQEV